MTQRLHPETLNLLNTDVLTPTYDRESLQPRIIHLGIGAFHRAHQAVYTEDAIAHSGGDWGIVGVSLRSDAVATQLRPQTALYSVMSQDATHTELRVVGSILDVLYAAENPDRVADAIAHSGTRLLTLTITEKGYCLASDGFSLDNSNNLIEADLEHPYSPASAIGLIAYGLHKRVANGGEPITVLSCDNLSENSQRLKAVLTEYLHASFADVIPWLHNCVSFPCSMVDRIVPGATTEQKIMQSTLLGLQDDGAISTEFFKQWIIEDRFANTRPAWDQVGVEFVDDILPFENIKLRVLNASHSAIAFCGLLAGLDTVDQVMNDEQLASFVTRLIDTELIPAIDAPDGFDLLDYRNRLLRRYQNPHLRHRCAQIAMDSSEKISQRWLPAFAADANTTLLTTSLSMWCFFVLHTDMIIEDPQAEHLMSQRTDCKPIASRVKSTLAIARFHSDSVGNFERLNTLVLADLDFLVQYGLREFLRR
ncbi:MAG: mannitol dehydrogenase family protein [Pseudomonadota bacterium]